MQIYNTALTGHFARGTGILRRFLGTSGSFAVVFGDGARFVLFLGLQTGRAGWREAAEVAQETGKRRAAAHTCAGGWIGSGLALFPFGLSHVWPPFADKGSPTKARAVAWCACRGCSRRDKRGACPRGIAAAPLGGVGALLRACTQPCTGTWSVRSSGHGA